MFFSGGSFTALNGTGRNRLGAVDNGAGTTTRTWDPGVGGGSAIVNALHIVGANIFVGGSFTSVDGALRNNVAVCSVDTGNSNPIITTWNPNANNVLNSFASVGNTLYMAGTFTSVGGTARNRIAAFDISSLSTVNLSTWNPSSSNTITGIAIDPLVSNTVYPVGSFATIGSPSRVRNGAAALNSSSAAAELWLTNIQSSDLETVVIDGQKVIFGGKFIRVNGFTFGGIIVMNTYSGIPEISTQAGISDDPGSPVNLLASSNKTFLNTGGRVTQLELPAATPMNDVSVNLFGSNSNAITGSSSFVGAAKVGLYFVSSRAIQITSPAAPANPATVHFLIRKIELDNIRAFSPGAIDATTYAGLHVWRYTGSSNDFDEAIVPSSITVTGNDVDVAFTTTSLTNAVFRVGASPADNPLPIELLYLNAFAQSRGVKLTWATATELNNEGFLLSRSTDPLTGFETIASYIDDTALRGSGTTRTETSYAFLDDVLPDATALYYNLKSVDFDGTVYDHGIVKVNVVPALNDNVAFPNPFYGQATVRCYAPGSGDVTLKVFSVQGQLMLQDKSSATEKGFISFDIDTPNWENGIYLACVFHNGKLLTTAKLIRR